MKKYKKAALTLLTLTLIPLLGGAVESKNPASPLPADTNDRKPLHLAALGGCTQNVKLLLRINADINVTDNKDLTPLHLAALGGHNEIISFLISQGAHIEATDNRGNTPLHLAALTKKGESIKLLVGMNANPNAENHKGLTPLAIIMTTCSTQGTPTATTTSSTPGNHTVLDTNNEEEREHPTPHAASFSTWGGSASS